MRAPFIAILGVVGLLAPARADPGLPRARLLYVVDPGARQCPDVGAMREAVAARLGYVPWHEAAARQVVVALARAEKGVRARIELRNAAGEVQGHRVLASASSDCRELAAAVELAISLAVDPLSLTRRQRATQAHDREPIPEQLLPPRGGLRAAPRAHGRTALSVSAGGLVALGSAPAVAGGIAIQARLLLHTVSVALEGRFDLPAYREVPGGRASTSLILGSALGCLHVWHASGCVVVGAGGLRGSGHGLADAQSHTLPYLTCGLRLGGEIPLVSVLALRVYGDLLGALSRITLQASDAQATEIWSTPPVSGAIGLALVGHLW